VKKPKWLRWGPDTAKSDNLKKVRQQTDQMPGGVYEVIKQLPHNGREYQYRIKSANEEHEGVAGKGELTKA